MHRIVINRRKNVAIDFLLTTPLYDEIKSAIYCRNTEHTTKSNIRLITLV